jgi:hypothetical protein
MNNDRRLLLKENLEQLERISAKLREVWIDEETQYEARSPASMETAQGVASKEAIDALEGAVVGIDEACEILKTVVTQA